MKHLQNSNKKFSGRDHYDLQIKSSNYSNQLQECSQFQQYSMQKNYLNTQRSQKSIKSTTCIPQRLYEISSNTKTQPAAYQPSSNSSFQKLTQIYGEVSKMKKSIAQIQQSIKSFKVIIDQVEEQRSCSGVKNQNIFETIKNQINNLTFILNHQLGNANSANDLYFGNGNQPSYKRLSSNISPQEMEQSFRRCSIQLQQSKFNLIMSHPEGNKLMRNMTQQSLELFIQIQARYEKLVQYLQGFSVKFNDQNQYTNRNTDIITKKSIRMTSLKGIQNESRNHSLNHSQSQVMCIIEQDDRNLIQTNISQFLTKIRVQKKQQDFNESPKRFKSREKVQTNVLEDSFEIKRIKTSFKQKLINSIKKLFEEYSENLKYLMVLDINFRQQNQKSVAISSYNIEGSAYQIRSQAENYLNVNFMGYSQGNKNIYTRQYQNYYPENMISNSNQNPLLILEPLLVSVRIFKKFDEIQEQIYYAVRYFQCLLHQYEAKLRESLEVEEQNIKNISLGVKKQNFQLSLKQCEQKISKCQQIISQIFLIQDYFNNAQRFKTIEFFQNIFYRHGNGLFSQKQKHKIQNHFKNKKIYLTYLIDYLNVQNILSFKYKKLMTKSQEYAQQHQSTQNSKSSTASFTEELLTIKQNILQKLLYPYQLIQKHQKDQKKYRQYIINGIIYNSCLHSYLDKIHDNQDYELFQNKEGPYLIQKIKEMLTIQNQRFMTTIANIKCLHGESKMEKSLQQKNQSKKSNQLSLGNQLTPKSSNLKINSSSNQSLAQSFTKSQKISTSQMLGSKVSSQTCYNQGNENIIRHIQACRQFSVLLRYVPTHYFQEQLQMLNRNNFLRYVQQQISQIHDKNQLYSQLIKQNSLYQFSQYEIYQLNEIFVQVKILQKQCIHLLQIFVQINFEQTQQDARNLQIELEPSIYQRYRKNSHQQKEFKDKLNFYNISKFNVFDFSLKTLKKQHQKLLQQNWSARTNINSIYSTLEKQIRQQKRKISSNKAFSLSTLRIMENNSIMFHNPSLRQRWNEYLSEVFNLIYENAYKKICNQQNIVKKESQKLIKQMQQIKNIIRFRDQNQSQNCKKIDEIIKMYKKI